MKKQYFKIIPFCDETESEEIFFVNFNSIPDHPHELLKFKDITRKQLDCAICLYCKKTRYATKKTNWSSCEC